MSDARSLAYQRRRARTRRAIIDAAVVLFHECGYERATAEEIASRAGCGRATFYLHFDSKAQVMIAALELLWEDQDLLSERTRERVQAGVSRHELAAEIASSVQAQTFPVRALHAAMLSDQAVAEWFAREQDRALGILVGSPRNVSSPEFARLRARFHLLGRMALDAMDPGPFDARPRSVEASGEYLGELWADLVIEISLTRESLAVPGPS